MKVYIIAAEPSSDFIASLLVKQMKKIKKELVFRAWGGENLKNLNVDIAMDTKNTSIMGFSNIIKNILKVRKQYIFCKNDILRFNPCKIILIDYGGLNLRIAKFAKNKNIEVCYYVPPKIWAWNIRRVKIIKKYVDKLFIIFPFEKELYKSHGVNAKFFGNPIFENSINLNRPKKNIIALLPGSRDQEVKRILPIMLKITNNFKSFNFLIVKSSNVNVLRYEKILRKISASNVKLVDSQSKNILSKSTVAIVASGTATLEAVKFNVPQIVCYKTNYINFFLAKFILKVKYISLVNILTEKECVKELIQMKLNEKNLIKELKIILNNEKVNKIVHDYKKIHKMLSINGTSFKIAKDILS